MLKVLFIWGLLGKLKIAKQAPDKYILEQSCKINVQQLKE